jgi:hypothetical protein
MENLCKEESIMSEQNEVVDSNPTNYGAIWALLGVVSGLFVFALYGETLWIFLPGALFGFGIGILVKS